MSTLLNESLITKPVTSFDEQSIANLMDELKSGADSAITDAVDGLGFEAIDCCGTGGSGSAKFNTSTAVAFVLAAAGLKVIKFGNRSASGSSGSIDFLTKCGLPASIGSGAIKDIFERTNLLFLNARDVYPAVGTLADVRKKIGKPSILNYIGPLLNPAQPEFRLLGVSHPLMQDVLADYLATDPAVTRAMIVRSENNVDELEPQANNFVIALEGTVDMRARSAYQLNYDQYFQAGSSHTRLNLFSRSSDINVLPLVEKNFRSFATILNGFDCESENYRSIVLNAAASLLAAGSQSSLREGIEQVEELIRNGVVLRKFQEVRRIYRERA